MAVRDRPARPKRVTAISLEREIRAFSRHAHQTPVDVDAATPARGQLLNKAIDATQASVAMGHGPAWMAVGVGAGIIGYFSLPSEPQLWALLVAVIAFAAISWKARHSAALYPALMALSIVSGTALVASKAQVNPTPQILSESVQLISGRVLRLEQRTPSRARLTLDRLVLEDQTPAQTPHRVRITVIANTGDILPGQRIEALARLGPPPEPVMPGARNLRRELFFAKIGATGFSYGRVTVLAEPTTQSLLQRVERVRLSLATRFAQALPGDTGVLAATLLVGKRDGLSPESYEALRRAGLAHLLAISGMHMAMMTLSAIALLHLVMAMTPKLSASKRATRWAALAGLCIASGYLLLSGAGTATQRAFIMIAIALFAMVLARRALTIRAVAFAAVLVLALHPENLLGPSFQMSFAATLALVAVYGGLSTSKTAWRWRLAADNHRAVASMPLWVKRPLVVVVGIASTSLIAGLATAPFAAYHFSVGAPLSLLGNVLALPLVSLIIMPAGLLALLLTPFALEGLPLAAMGFGLDQVMIIARWVASMEGSRIAVPALTPQALTVLTAAGVMAALLVGRARLLALPVLALLPLVGILQPTPVVLIERSAATVGLVLTDAGQRALYPSVPRGSAFSRTMWQQRLAIVHQAGEANPWACDPLGCIADWKGQKLAHVRDPAALAEDCRLADVLITQLPAPLGCTASLIVDGETLNTHGAIALLANGDGGLRIWRTFQRRTRPWEGVAD